MKPTTFDAKEYQQQYREKNREQLSLYQREYRQQNKKKISVLKKQYYQQNRETLLKKSKQYQSTRKEHNKDYRLKRCFGISLEEYNRKLQLQEFQCAICHIHQDELTLSLSVDHNHKTNQIRGLLCNNCNTAIGRLKENPEYFKNAVEYLDHYS